MVENAGTVSINFHSYNIYGKRGDGSYCDGDSENICDVFFYFKYRECYENFTICTSYVTNYYYSGVNSATMDKVYDYTTTSSFSVSFKLN